MAKFGKGHLVLGSCVDLERGRVVQDDGGAQVAREMLPLGHHAVDFVRFLVLLNAEVVLCSQVIPKISLAVEDFAALQAFILTSACPFV